MHVGCGLKAPEGWINLDGSINAWFSNHAKFARLLSPIIGKGWQNWPQGIVWTSLNGKLPFATSSVNAIYTSHFVEHLTQKEAIYFLGEAYRILEPGGVIRIVVPDLAGAARAYIQAFDAGDCSAANKLLNSLYICKTNRMSVFRPRDLFSLWCDYQTHFWMYDPLSLKELLREQGFVDIDQLPALSSERIENLQVIERSDAIGTNGEGFAMEGCKPMTSIEQA